MQQKAGFNTVVDCIYFIRFRYLPKTHGIIDKKVIQIISARSKYGA